PSPLVGEGGRRSRPDEGFYRRIQRERFARGEDPSPVFASRSHPLPQGERGRKPAALTAFEQGWMAGSSPTLTAAAVSRNKSGRSSRRPAQAYPRPRSRR